MWAEPEQTVVPANGLGNRVASNSDGANVVERSGPAGENFRENDTLIENYVAATAAHRSDPVSLSLGETLLQACTLLQEVEANIRYFETALAVITSNPHP
jgi:hypothetical protein